jgi:hypothetical protein
VECGGPSVQPPCYVVNGILTLNTVGKTPGEVQADTLQILQSLDYDAIASTVPGINGATVLGAQVTVNPTTAPANINNDGTSSPTGSASLTSAPTTPSTQVKETPQLNETAQSNETTAPTIYQSQTEQQENPANSGGLDWWRWLIFALILVAAFLAIYVVYKKCDNQPKGGKESVQGGASQGADASQSEDEMGRWE